MQHDLLPTQTSERISSLDFLRGIAVLGILIINIESFAYPDSWSPFKSGYYSATDHDVRFWVYFLAQGKFFGMFTMLFGAGFYIFLERLENKGVGLKALDIYARRLLWLFVFGCIHAYLIWDGDVLFHYAVCGFLLFPFRSFSVKQLLLVLLVPVSIQLYNSYESAQVTREKYEEYTTVKNIAADMRSSDEQEKVKRWTALTTIGEPDFTQESVRNTLCESWEANAENTKVHKGRILHTGIFFRTILMMILGIILYKTNIFRDPASLKYYWPLTVFLLIVSGIINYYWYYHWTFEYYQPVMNTWKSFLFTFPKETMAVGYILLFNGLYHKLFKRIIFKPISTAGKMALSNYILQSILCGIIFYGYGLGKFNQYSRSELLLVIAAIWLFQLLISWLWMRKFTQGPLERLWRILTYR